MPFFSIGMKTDLFQSFGHCRFPNLLHTECSTSAAASFRIWNSSTEMPSPPLALFIVMCAYSVTYNSLWPHGLQAARLHYPYNFPGKNLEWVAFSYSRGSSWPWDQTHISCIGGGFFTNSAIWEGPRRGLLSSKRNELFIYTEWMILKMIMLYERKQTKNGV